MTSRHRLRLFALLCLGLLLVSIPTRAEEVKLSWRMYTPRDGLAAPWVASLAVGRQGTLWAGTYGGGLSRFNGKSWRTFTTLDGLGDNWVTAVAVGTDGTVWAGTYGGGLSHFDGQTWKTYTEGNSGLPGNWVTALAASANGQIWAGTYGGGLAHFDGQTWRAFDPSNSGLNTRWITSLAIDRHGNLWAGSSGDGLIRYDGREWRTFHVADGLASDFVNAVAVDASGRIWAGTDEGLSVYDGKTLTPALSQRERERLPLSTPLAPPKVGGMGGQAGSEGLGKVTAIAAGPGAVLCVGTGHGLYRFLADPGNTWPAQWTKFTIQDGLVQSFVSALAVDGAGNVWVGTGRGLSRSLEMLAGEDAGSQGAEDTKTESRLPVILIHGWHGPVETEDPEFKFLRRWLADDGFPVFYATGIDSARTLDQNARQLRDDIAAVKARTGAQQVHLIGHSMGGLNARAYVESALYAGDVASVTTLGTPHGGVQLWKDFLAREISRGSTEPSARELLPEHVSLFNQFHRKPEAVPYYLLGGDIQRQELLSILKFWPPNDGIISTWSALALDGPNVYKFVTSDLHGWGLGSLELGLPSYLWPDTTYRTILRPLLMGEEREQGCRGAEESLPPLLPCSPAPMLPRLQPPGPQNRTPYLSGDLQPGTVVTHTIEIDTNRAARILTFWRNGHVDVQLTDPSGRRIASSPASRDDVRFFAFEADTFANFALFETKNAQPGRWTVTLRGDDLPSTVDYTVYALLDSDLKLAISQPADVHQPGSSMVVTATLATGKTLVTGAQVEARVDAPGVTSSPVRLLDDGQHDDGRAGDGVYGGHLTAPQAGGYYPIVVTARSELQGQRFERAQSAFAIVSPATARLSGPYTMRLQDQDGDGQPEALLLNLWVDVARPGDYALGTIVEDSGGQEVTRSWLPQTLPVGKQLVSIPITEGDSYTIRELALFDTSGAAIEVDSIHGPIRLP